MVDPSAVYPLAGNLNLPAPTGGAQDKEDAVDQFQALLIKELLSTMRESGGSAMKGGEDTQAQSYFWSMLDEQIATHMAKEDALGLREILQADPSLA